MTTHGATSLCNAAIELKVAGVGSRWNAQMTLARFAAISGLNREMRETSAQFASAPIRLMTQWYSLSTAIKWSTHSEK